MPAEVHLFKCLPICRRLPPPSASLVRYPCGYSPNCARARISSKNAKSCRT
jgi:hypothetical protein